MNIKIKIIIWLFIWIITFCSSQMFCLTEIQKTLIEIINSYTFTQIIKLNTKTLENVYDLSYKFYFNRHIFNNLIIFIPQRIKIPLF